MIIYNTTAHGGVTVLKNSATGDCDYHKLLSWLPATQTMTTTSQALWLPQLRHDLITTSQALWIRLSHNNT